MFQTVFSYSNTLLHGQVFIQSKTPWTKEKRLYNDDLWYRYVINNSPTKIYIKFLFSWINVNPFHTAIHLPPVVPEKKIFKFRQFIFAVLLPVLSPLGKERVFLFGWYFSSDSGPTFTKLRRNILSSNLRIS